MMIGFIIWFIGYIVAFCVFRYENKHRILDDVTGIGEAMLFSLISWFVPVVYFVFVSLADGGILKELNDLYKAKK